MKKVSGFHHHNLLPSRHIQQVPVSRNNQTRIGRHRRRQEDIVGRISTHTSYQWRRVDDGRVHRDHIKDGEHSRAPFNLLCRKFSTDSGVLIEDGWAQHQRYPFVRPSREDLAGHSTEEDSRDQDIGIENQLHLARRTLATAFRIADCFMPVRFATPRAWRIN